MFGKKKVERPRQRQNRNGQNLSQFGLFDIPNDLNFDTGLNEDVTISDNDSDLESELLALARDNRSTVPKRPPRRKVEITHDDSENRNASEDDESVDENDPELLSELNEITGENDEEPQEMPSAQISSAVSDVQKTLEARLEMYKTAEKNAKVAGETSRARRFGRGIKQLEDLIKQAKLGKAINEEDIPPEVSVKPHTPASTDNQVQPSRPAPPIPTEAIAPEEPSKDDSTVAPETGNEASKENTSSVNQELLNMLNSRKNEYKIAALKAKKAGNNENAINYIKVAKQFEVVINAVESGQEVDLSGMPGPPADITSKVEQNQVQTTEDTNTEENSKEIEIPEPTLITAGSLLEALEQRLEVYKKQEEKAKEEGNSSKVRRMGRIVKQFQDAIKLHKAGKSIPIDELPTPPGYAPLAAVGESSPKADEMEMPKPKPKISSPEPKPAESSSAKTPQTVGVSGNRKLTTRADKQLALLLERQKEFKVAALNAKQKGEITQAKEYLRTAKGFDPLIEAAQGGLPVDFNSLPLPPTEKVHLEDEVEVVMAEECTEDDQGTLDVLRRLEQQLVKQLKMCIETRDHNKAIGDVAGANRFENLALSVSKDIDTIRLARRTTGSQIPKYHYETKDFSVVKTFTELKDNDLELTIFRGVNYSCSNPDYIDTYVRFEFPWPQDDPMRNKTSVAKNTNNPEYNATFWLPIERKSRQCQRVFKRHGVKFEVYSKGCSAGNIFNCCSGLFRGDSLLGTVTVKLQPLETRCEIHDSFDLMDGRKKVGGKLEVRLRIRDPIVTREIQQSSERWLVIDSLT